MKNLIWYFNVAMTALPTLAGISYLVIQRYDKGAYWLFAAGMTYVVSFVMK